MATLKGKAFVDAKIAGKKVMVFSKSSCPFCVMAKKSLKDPKSGMNPADCDIVEIEGRDDCSDIQNYLSQITGARTVPRVFVNGTCIGGGTETRDMVNSGKFKQLLG